MTAPETTAAHDNDRGIAIMVVTILVATGIFVVSSILDRQQIAGLEAALDSQQLRTVDVIEAYCKETTGLPYSDGLTLDGNTERVTAIGCHDGTNHTRTTIGESN